MFFSFLLMSNLERPIEMKLKDTPDKSEINLRTAGVIGQLNLTNQEINETRHPQGSILIVEGKIYEPLDPITGLEGLNVSIKVDGNYDNLYNDTTDSSGEFQINYLIPNTLTVFLPHKIEVNVTDDLGGGEIEVLNHYIIYTSTNSHVNINFANSDDPSLPKLVGESFRVEGSLRYDNGSLINTNTNPAEYMSIYLTNKSNYIWDQGDFNTLGNFFQDILIPDTPSDFLNLKLNYTGRSPEINGSEFLFFNIPIFRNISCVWEIDSEAEEGEEITIMGTVTSDSNSSILINNREIEIYYDGTFIDSVLTDANGKFQVDYTIPEGAGVKLFEISLLNGAGVSVTTSQGITIIETEPEDAPSLGDGETPPPFLGFAIIFIPIIIGIVVALSVYGYLYYKKQEEESRVVNVPLADKLQNLQILKETGRIEEALSYLFNAIYMELINAKFTRTRKATETIRDFAIVSVTELKLNPAIIYPFIQKVEEMIYARPNVQEKDFYDTIELFSPVYFDLTGYNFVLNF